MKFAGRMNSFVLKGDSIFDAIARCKEIEGLTHLEFNYPEHFEGCDFQKIVKAVGDMKVNGIATRFREPFLKGEFTNEGAKTRDSAICLCKEAVDACRALGGDTVTVWQSYDGFDYPFQQDYETAWNRMIEAFREVADYAKDIRISIEYKPFEPRNFAMLDGVGTTLLAIKEINRDNVGITLDLCHMLMKHDEPSYSLALAAKDQRLFGLHLNDGYQNMDGGMIFGSVHLSQCIEFVYYLKKYGYKDVVFFDTFPIRENPVDEITANISAFCQIESWIDAIGMDHIGSVIQAQDGIKAHQLVFDMLRLGANQ